MADTKYDKEFRIRFRKLDAKLSKHTKNIQKIVDDFMLRPGRSNVYWQSVRVALNKEYAAAGAVFSDWVDENIPWMVEFTEKEQMRYSRKLKSVNWLPKYTAGEIVNTDFTVQTTKALTQSAIEDFLGALAMGKRDMERLIRITRQTLIDEYLVDKSIADAYTKGDLRIATKIGAQNSLANRLMQAANGGQFMTIIDKNGKPRKYGFDTYAEVVGRTKWHEAQAAGVKAVAANYSTDLVKVSSHNTSTKICQEFEGKIFSINGVNKDFPRLTQSPPFHPNCIHYIMVTFAESMKATGSYKDYSEFSKGEIPKPPGAALFVPVSERNKK